MKILKIGDLKAILAHDNGEPLVYFHGVLVRKTVSEKLKTVEEKLQEYGMNLVVAEGYRSPSRQEEYFLIELLVEYKQDPTVDLELLLERTHARVALPSVAGHPTGGAVDVTISGKDMGSAIADFSKPELLPTHSPHVTEEQMHLRRLLHDVMISEGFAPFYGEWWHFSYGDREWAAFYGKRESLYSPK